jgi:hypothetical protein
MDPQPSQAVEPRGRLSRVLLIAVAALSAPAFLLCGILLWEEYVGPIGSFPGEDVFHGLVTPGIFLPVLAVLVSAGASFSRALKRKEKVVLWLISLAGVAAAVASLDQLLRALKF